MEAQHPEGTVTSSRPAAWDRLHEMFTALGCCQSQTAGTQIPAWPHASNLLPLPEL